jgi:hypothetical protein
MPLWKDDPTWARAVRQNSGLLSTEDRDPHSSAEKEQLPVLRLQGRETG